MRTLIKMLGVVLAVSFAVFLSCVASERKVERTEPVRLDTPATETGDPNASVQPNVHPASPEEWDWQTMNVRTETAQPPLRSAPVHVVRFESPALPTPILDQRRRECIAYPLIAGFTKVRYNLLLQPNLYDVTIRNWSDPQWLATFRVDGGTFPVNLWRLRDGEAAFWKTVRVQAGPELPTGNPQVALSAAFFRGGDALCVETPRRGGAVFVAYDQQTGHVVQPQLSAIQISSNDSTPIHGVWMTIGGAE